MTEVQCVMPKITEECKPKCTVEFEKFEACTVRLQTGKHDGDCQPWFFDYMKCIDKCRGPQIFKQLK